MSDRSLQFLLVEDSEEHAMLVQSCLEDTDWPNKVDRVCDGVEAIKYLQHEPPYEDSPRPDVILLDLKLPLMSGHDVLTKIKQDEKLQSIPVVVLTTSKAEQDLRQAYAHHVNSYLVKPVEYDRLSQMIGQLADYWGQWNYGPVKQSVGL